MNRTTAAISYIFFIGLLAAVMWYVFDTGKTLEQTAFSIMSAQKHTSLAETVNSAIRHPVAIFILQLVLVIASSQVCAYFFKKIGQPAVMGEIIAGILLGPSLLGAIAPAFSSFVFPASSLGNLQMLSQVGVILFMFVIGMDLDTGLLRKKARAALLISYFSIIVPFILGILLSLVLYDRYAPQGIPFYAFSLFTGIALSITAFPVLARIIRERKMSNTNAGTIALTAAAVGDVAAWCILAFIVAIVKAGSVAASLYTLACAVIFTLVMLFVVRPLMRTLAQRSVYNSTVKRSVMAVVFVVMLLSAYCCEIIGIHALFGAFLAGAIMPADEYFRKALMDKIEDVALVLLLPLFFVFTGLRTQVGLLSDSSLWFTCCCIIAIAVAGKFGGSYMAARIARQNRKDSLSIAALMNTRGLVELVVLNIGYDLGILTPQVFTMMVLMALVTTFMTNPALNVINRIYR